MTRSNKRRKVERLPRLTVDDVRAAIHAAVDAAPESEAPATQTPPEGEEAASFDVALHAFALSGRPRTAQDVRDLARCVCAAVRSCGGDRNLLRVFLLSACRRRYHAKAPEAKRVSEPSGAASSDGDEAARARTDADTGDGERLVFYVTALTLSRLAGRGHPGAEEGFGALAALSGAIGGSRDVSSLLVHGLYGALLDMPESPLLKSNGGILEDSAPGDAKKAALVSAIRRVCVSGELGKGAEHRILLGLVASIAKLLDEDLELVKASSQPRPKETGRVEDVSPIVEPLMSTHHVFLPHHDRGNRKGASWRRNLVNSVAELLIWQHTEAAKAEERFGGATTALEELSDAASVEESYRQILKMQTSTRKFLQTLNSHARKEGFQLCSQFRMDPSAVTFQMVCRGKKGDVEMLRSLAKAANDARVLRLVTNRGLTAKKAVPAESVFSLIKHINEVDKEGKGTDDEISALERQIFQQTLEATLAEIRRSVSKSNKTRPKVCICLDSDVPNQVCAALVAAALTPACRLDEDVTKASSAADHSLSPTACRLLLPSFGDVDVSNFDSLVMLLQNIVDEEKSDQSKAGSPVAGLRTAEDAVRDIGPGHDVLLFASYSVQMDAGVLRELRDRDCTVRAHNVGLLLQKGEVRDIGAVQEVHLDLGSGTRSILCGACTLKWRDQPDRTEVVHYSNRRSEEHNAVTHSGDTTDESGHSCHTIDVKLRDLPAGVDTLWFTLCSCGCANLGEFDEPRIRFVNKHTGSPLCEYRLQKAGAAKSVVMAVLTRSPDDPNRWFVQAVGGSEAEATQRCCMNYGCMEPLYKSLRGLGVGCPKATAATSEALFNRENVAGVSSSVGGEISKLCQLCRIEADHKEVKQVKAQLKSAQKNENDGKVLDTQSTKFELTQRDVLYLQLSRLPSICESTINTKLGICDSLAVLAARNVADQLRKSGQNLEEIRDALPEDFVGLITKQLSNFGIAT